ncbi:MAG TPA: penicillin-binding transpeptidase domain-containing protein [Candidatus Angelobacter sp.]|nr:penicillin-binding transpeptidase domain-containing protein [Candidatus Angelobacter sp.]
MLTLFRFLCVALCLASGLSAQQPPAAPELQSQLAQLMKGKPGAAAVLDVASGKLIASWNLKLAAQRLAAPGSTVKPFVLDKLLRAGKLRPEKRLVCRRPLYISGRRMDCSHSPAITDLDAADAIAYSCNSYFAAVATQLTPQELADVYRRAGFVSLTRLAPSEVAGRIIPAPSTGQLQLQALGDWGVEITPLELLWAYRNLALQKRHNETGASAPVFDGLEHSVQYGMAHAAQPDGITAAGKTGTAAGRGTASTHAFFAGYAPAEKPEIVVMVYLENGRGADAAALAAPIFTAYGKQAHGAQR